MIAYQRGGKAGLSSLARHSHDASPRARCPVLFLERSRRTGRRPRALAGREGPPVMRALRRLVVPVSDASRDTSLALPRGRRNWFGVLRVVGRIGFDLLLYFSILFLFSRERCGESRKKLEVQTRTSVVLRRKARDRKEAKKGGRKKGRKRSFTGRLTHGELRSLPVAVLSLFFVLLGSGRAASWCILIVTLQCGGDSD